MADKPAILGGPPAFEKTFPIIRPSADEATTSGLSDRMHAVLQSNMLSNVGIYVRKLEEALEGRLRVDHVVATSSCTLGLILVLQALGLRGKRAAVPSFTFNATGLACYWTGNEIHYVDVDDTLTVDVKLLAALRGKVDFLLPVHLYGNPCDVDALQDWAAREQAPIVYDAAHALGSALRDKPVGGFGTAEVFSLSPTKLITTGEGGLVATNDAKLADRIRLLRNYGNRPDYTCDVPGLNARMSEINAVVGLEMLGHLDRYVESRNRYVERYKRKLAPVPGLEFQRIRNGARSGHKDFSAFVDPDAFGMDRDTLAKALEAERISTKKYFFPAMHELDAFRPKRRASLPVTDRASRRVLSLPIHNVMRESDIDRIADRIELIHAHAAGVREKLYSAP
jgi:dTDP-4-amino-4,6-dideoxygalactose transaminase